jgi:hypothetical protein
VGSLSPGHLRGVISCALAQEIEMKYGLAKADLPEPRKRLVELMQRVNFGRIENLIVRNGEPVLTPAPRIIREHKFAGENGPRPELGTGDFRLKAQLTDLFNLLDKIGNGTIAVLTIKHGLPFLADVPE